MYDWNGIGFGCKSKYVCQTNAGAAGEVKKPMTNPATWKDYKNEEWIVEEAFIPEDIESFT